MAGETREVLKELENGIEEKRISSGLSKERGFKMANKKLRSYFDEELVSKVLAGMKSNDAFRKLVNKFLRGEFSLSGNFDFTLGEMVDICYLLTAYIDSVKKRLSAHESILEALEQAIVSKMNISQVRKVSGSLGEVRQENFEYFSVGDWEKFKNFVRKNDALEFLQKRPALTVVRQYLEDCRAAGKEVEKILEEIGLTLYSKVKLYFRRV